MNPAGLSIGLLALFDRMRDRAAREDVHRLRTTVRRLEVQLGHCPSKVAKSLKHLRREAGKVRDIDVHLALLKPALLLKTSAYRQASSGLSEPSPDQPTQHPLQQRLRTILKEQRDRHLGYLREALASAAPLLQAKLPTLAERAFRSTADAHHVHQHVELARRRFLRWTRIVPEDAERLHRLRIHTKKLRYALEPLEEYPEAARFAAKLKGLQDAIGSWHDWATLEQLAQRELDSPDAEPMRAVLRARTRRECNTARRAAQRVRTWMIGSKPAVSAAAGQESQRQIRKAG